MKQGGAIRGKDIKVKVLTLPDSELCRDCLDRNIDAQSIIDVVPAIICVVDCAGKILRINDRWIDFGRINGRLDAAEDEGRNYFDVFEPGNDYINQGILTPIREVLAGQREHYSHVYPCHSPQEKHWYEMTVTPIRSPETGDTFAAVIMHSDVTKMRMAHERLTMRATESIDLEINSRMEFEELLVNRHLELGWETGALVVLMDLMDMRDMNDVHGYKRGDEILRTIARRVHQYSGGLSARTGGDEFFIYLPPDGDITPDERLRQLQELVQQPIELGAARLSMRACYGYHVLGAEAETFDEILRKAEVALNQAVVSKDQHNPVREFSSAADKAYHDRLRITSELSVALAEEQFELHFQPKVNIKDGSLVSAEALIRWRHPVRGLVPPGEFIPIAEQGFLIGPLGDWVLREAVRSLRLWHDEGLEMVRIAINISLNQFIYGDFCQQVERSLDEFGIPPDALSLEITERVFSNNEESVARELVKLRELGVHLSLDDFGTGYSSLSYLKRFAFDEVKIDRAFTSDILADDGFGTGIIKAIIAIADSMDMKVVAEGVESKEVADRLLELGCYTAQGFYYSMPLIEEDFRWLLRTCSNLPLPPAGDVKEVIA